MDIFYKTMLYVIRKLLEPEVAVSIVYISCVVNAAVLRNLLLSVSLLFFLFNNQPQNHYALRSDSAYSQIHNPCSYISKMKENVL